ncbi:cupin domain-containing protein [Halalkalibacter hemicellulosilyticus]|uniref:cupin domain-containing protein n=1 Tax=Halalkalibacter hemicellulosilyticus TaxID=127886 RepID=UPI00054E7956|nr:cupin domain-containing protein [Halalkalibacter hemicellulosilyticus]
MNLARKSGGKYEYIEVFLPPKGAGPPLHYHRKFEETFETVDGELKILLANEEKILPPSESFTVKKEEHHAFLNASDKHPVTFRVKLTPANNFETSMRIIYGLAADGEIDEKKGTLKNPMHTALALDMQDTRLVHVPKFIQKFMLDRLAKKAKRKGIDQQLIKKYVK